MSLSIRPIRLATACAVAGLLSPLCASAQEPATTPGQSGIGPVGETDADRLAAAVRRLGSSPRDLSALIDAAELSFRLGDATAAAALYKRAEQVDPANGRVKAGIARILVNGEHPGEALRLFDAAQRLGVAMAHYADDRGLAYDLIGEQERAQRDYRLALAQGGPRIDQNEVRRRYALSLGISGHKDEALTQIDTLLRQSDRGAWRARAFILAMNGDVSGANRIATGMMPPGMASGLAAFFQRLPTLGAVDRAFAVHFGEVTTTPARLADARLVPTLPALGPDPYAPRPVQVAVATPPAAVASARPLSRRERDRERREAEARARQVAAAEAAARRRPAPAAPAAGNSLTAAREIASGNGLPPSAVPSGAVAPVTASVDRASVTPAITAAPFVPSQVAAAPAQAVPVPSVAERSAGAATAVASPSAARGPVVPVPVVAATATAPRATAVTAPASPVAALPAAGSTASIGSGERVAGRTLSTAAAASPAVGPTRIATPGAVVARAPSREMLAVASSPETAPAQAAPVASPQPGFSLARGGAVPVKAAAAAPPPSLSDDSVLARIIAGISIPAAELGVAPAARAPAEGETLQEAARLAQRNAAANDDRRDRRAIERDRAAERRAKELVADRAREFATRRAAEAEAAAARKASRAEPARIWVQVAGGATEGDLGKAWRAAQGKAAVLKGRKGYTTPLRATHRVVTGPFKTEEEARAVVNQLAKQGLSAFTFTSTAGQKMTRLDEK